MNYYINPQTYSTAFPIPSQIVDNHLRLAKPEHILVILFLYRNISAMPSIKEICAATGIDEYDVNEALMYWEDAGILLKKDASPIIKESEPKAVIENKKPSRRDVAKRGLEDPKIRHLLGEAQFKFGRGLKSNETSTLVWVYDDLGLDVSLILIILQLACDKNKCNIRFIESVAVDWVNRGITTLALADEEMPDTLATLARELPKQRLTTASVCSRSSIGSLSLSGLQPGKFPVKLRYTTSAISLALPLSGSSYTPR